MKIKAYDSENIYDLAIRLYGNLAGIGELVGQVEDIDQPVQGEVDFEPVQFTPFIESSDPVQKQKLITLKVAENQSIYDVALQSGGNLSQLSSIISRYESLDQNLRGVEFVIIQNEDELTEIIQSRGLVFATKDAAEVISNWILALGAWNDSGIWIDDENWID